MAGINSFGQCPKPEYDFFDLNAPFTYDKFYRIQDIMDKNSLKKIGKYYYKDKNYVYYNYIRDVGSSGPMIKETLYLIENADPKTFEVYKKASFSRDKNNVYFAGFLIKSADSETFTPLSYYYGKDNIRAFFRNCEIENVDLQTFQVKEDTYAGGFYDFAYDKNYIYFRSQKEEIDIETFVVGESVNSCRDKNNIFHLSGKNWDEGNIIKEKIEKR